MRGIKVWGGVHPWIYRVKGVYDITSFIIIESELESDLKGDVSEKKHNNYM